MLFFQEIREETVMEQEVDQGFRSSGKESPEMAECPDQEMNVCGMCRKAVKPCRAGKASHVRAHHVKKKLYQCTTCFLATNYESKIQKHLRYSKQCIPLTGPGYEKRKKEFTMEYRTRMRQCFPKFLPPRTMNDADCSGVLNEQQRFRETCYRGTRTVA